MLNLLIFESVTANLKNIKKFPSQWSADDFKSIKTQGSAMLAALLSDLRKAKGINIIVGKQKSGESVNDFFSNISHKIDLAWVIAPESDGELENCYMALKNKIWIGAGLNAIRLTSNKIATKKHLLSVGVNTPAQITCNMPTSKNFSKVVCKPIYGAGTIDTYILDNPEKILAHRKNNSPQFFLERWVQGSPFSVSLNCTSDGFEVLSINEQIISVGFTGKFKYYGVRPASSIQLRRIQHLLLPILESFIPTIPDLRGFIGIDFILSDTDEINIIEINPRLTCSYIGMSNYKKTNIGIKILRSFGINNLI